MQETENYKKLQQETTELGDIVRLAKAIRRHDADLWSRLDRDTIRILLSDVLLWCKADPSHNPDLETPTGSLAGKACFYSWYKINLLEVLSWIHKNL